MGFSLSILLWSIFGRLPVRIEGRGVLMRTESLQLIQSETTGRIKDLKVKVGDCVKQGTSLALIEPVKLELEEKKAKEQLKALIANDARLDLIAIQREKELRKATSRWEIAFQEGLISPADWEEKKQKLYELLYTLESSNTQR
ncbi:MAG TPA: biotin/lipoyl-binding protein, partial [Prochlorococcus sp.]